MIDATPLHTSHSHTRFEATAHQSPRDVAAAPPTHRPTLRDPSRPTDSTRPPRTATDLRTRPSAACSAATHHGRPWVRADAQVDGMGSLVVYRRPSTGAPRRRSCVRSRGRRSRLTPHAPGETAALPADLAMANATAMLIIAPQVTPQPQDQPSLISRPLPGSYGMRWIQ